MLPRQLQAHNHRCIRNAARIFPLVAKLLDLINRLLDVVMLPEVQRENALMALLIDLLTFIQEFCNLTSPAAPASA